MRDLISLKEFIGLIASGLIPGIVLGLIGTAQDSAWALPIVMPIGLATALIVGLPIILFLNSKRLFGLVWYLLVGVFVSIALTSFFLFFIVTIEEFGGTTPSNLALYVIVLALSVLTTATYWLVIRPDKIHAA